MNHNKCPLCHSDTSTLSELIPSDLLIRLYQDQFKIDTASMFAGYDTVHFMDCRTCNLRYTSPPITGNDAFYQALQELDWYYMPDKWEFRETVPSVKSQDWVLEVGCGKGHFFESLACAAYVGLETSAAAIATKGQPEKRLSHETVETHAEANAARYDVVCSFQVLEHVADPASFINACLKALRPGGLLLLSTPNADSFVSLVVNYTLDLPPHHVTHWQAATWEYMPHIFPMTLQWIKNEPLQEYHRAHYANTMAVALARRVVGLAEKRVDASPGHKEALRLGKQLNDAALAILADPRVQPARGHTTLVCFRKNG